MSCLDVDSSEGSWRHAVPKKNMQSLRSGTRKQEPSSWLLIGLLIPALACAGLWKKIFITIPAGHHGVMFHRFSGGTLTERVFGEGLYVVAPWNVLAPYETRLNSRTVALKVPSEEGLEMEISISLRYRPYLESLGYLHKDIGPDYFERLILPEVHGHLRKVLGKKKAQDIYTGAREILEEIANVPVLSRLHSRPGAPLSQKVPEAVPYVLLEELRVLDIVRPSLVANAVNEKQRQEQLSLEYKHRLQREEQEAERKRIEAIGIRNFKRISDTDILRWRNLETTLELARSNNAKIVVLGNGPGALPMMMNLGETPPQEGATSKTAPKPDKPASLSRNSALNSH